MRDRRRAVTPVERFRDFSGEPVVRLKVEVALSPNLLSVERYADLVRLCADALHSNGLPAAVRIGRLV